MWAGRTSERASVWLVRRGPAEAADAPISPCRILAVRRVPARAKLVLSSCCCLCYVCAMPALCLLAGLLERSIWLPTCDPGGRCRVCRGGDGGGECRQLSLHLSSSSSSSSAAALSDSYSSYSASSCSCCCCCCVRRGSANTSPCSWYPSTSSSSTSLTLPTRRPRRPPTPRLRRHRRRSPPQ
jgi:hypothetical protein